MKSIDFIILGIVAMIMCVAFKASTSHMKGEGGCCGGKDNVIEEPDKKLNNPIIGKITLNVYGMTCMNCSNRVKRSLNKMEDISAKVNLKKGVVTIEYSKEVEMESCIQTIENLGYHVQV